MSTSQPTPESKPRYREQLGTVLANHFLYYAQGYPRLKVALDVTVIFNGGRTG